MKRVVVISDLHCGHRAGLTPPGWQYPIDIHDESIHKYAKQQRAMWEWFTATIDSLQPIDALIVNGDAIEGKGDRSGSTELIEADRIKQTDIAAECIKYVNPKYKIFLVYGTPYHTGKDEDFETIITKSMNVDTKICSHPSFDIYGKIFNVKHKVGGSSIPYGRHTAISRASLWNLLASERKAEPRADVIIRSHVHYFAYNGDWKHLNIITPCLQGFGSKFGTRQCDGTIDIGLIYFDVHDGGDLQWGFRLMDQEFLADVPYKL